MPGFFFYRKKWPSHSPTAATVTFGFQIVLMIPVQSGNVGQTADCAQPDRNAGLRYRSTLRCLFKQTGCQSDGLRIKVKALDMAGDNARPDRYAKFRNGGRLA